jgi:hypothetical protein
MNLVKFAISMFNILISLTSILVLTIIIIENLWKKILILLQNLFKNEKNTSIMYITWGF